MCNTTTAHVTSADHGFALLTIVERGVSTYHKCRSELISGSGKCEWENPGSSIKDRAALWMIKHAESTGQLVRGRKGAIVEGTAGNTGIGDTLLHHESA